MKKLMFLLPVLILLSPGSAVGQEPEVPDVPDVQQPPTPSLDEPPAVTVQSPPPVDPGSLQASVPEPDGAPSPAPQVSVPEPDGAPSSVPEAAVSGSAPSVSEPSLPPLQMPSVEDAQEMLDQLGSAPGQVSASPPDPSSLTVVVPSLGGNAVPTPQWPSAPGVQMPSVDGPGALLSQFDTAPEWPDLSAALSGQPLPFPDPALPDNAANTPPLTPPLSTDQLRASITESSDADGEPELVLPQASQGVSFSPIWLLMGMLAGLLAGTAVMTLFRRRAGEEDAVVTAAQAGSS